MGMVTDVHWHCPCGFKNISQLYYKTGDPEEGFHHGAFPIDRLGDFKWNEPCERCSEYTLTPPTNLMVIPISLAKEKSNDDAC
jgi:hypothetical protein